MLPLVSPYAFLVSVCKLKCGKKVNSPPEPFVNITSLSFKNVWTWCWLQESFPTTAQVLTPQRLTTLWAFTACYRDSFTLLLPIYRKCNSTEPNSWEVNSFSTAEDIPTFCGTRMFVAMFAWARHWSLSCARRIQSTPSYLFTNSFNISYLCLGISDYLCFPIKNFVLLYTPMRSRNILPISPLIWTF
jgi:hypothetical protein